MVRLGTKWPSMMSIWMTEPPPRSAASISKASFEKSAERMDGTNSTMITPRFPSVYRTQMTTNRSNSEQNRLTGRG